MNHYMAGTEVRIREINGIPQDAPAVIVAGPLKEWEARYLCGYALLQTVRNPEGDVIYQGTIINLADADIVEMVRDH
jgi:hypothetical protein